MFILQTRIRTKDHNTSKSQGSTRVNLMRGCVLTLLNSVLPRLSQVCHCRCPVSLCFVFLCLASFFCAGSEVTYPIITGARFFRVALTILFIMSCLLPPPPTPLPVSQVSLLWQELLNSHLSTQKYTYSQTK